MKKLVLLLAVIVGMTFTACKKDDNFNPAFYTPVVGATIQTVQTAWGLPTSIGGTTYNDAGQQVITHFYPAKKATIVYVDGKVDKVYWQ